MNVNVVIGEEAFFNSELSRIGADPGQRGLHGFLHDLANLPGHGESAFAFHDIGFDEQYIAARGSPRQPDGNSGAFGALGDFALAADFDSAKKFLNYFFGNEQFLGLAFGQAARLFAADCANIALQVADTCLARVMADQIAHRLVREFNLFHGNSVFLNLARHQVLECDVDLLFFGITLQLDNLHAIAQRLGYRIEHVGRGDE